MNVLVVDDSRAMRMIVSRTLREVELVDGISEAESAEAAIEVLGSTPVDLVVCDWNMEGMTGLELLEALRAAGWTTPFGFVTSESSDAVVDAARATGAAFLVAKPFQPEELRARVEAVLSGSASVTDAVHRGEDDRPAALQQLLSGLLRRPVEAVVVEEGPPRQSARWLARYVDPAGAEVALCVVEMPLALAAGAALSMMPLSEGTVWAASGALPDALAENLHEVTNVVAKLVHADGVRCVLSGLDGFAPGEQLPEIEAIRAARAHENFEVTVDGYGGGRLSLVTL